MQDLQVVPGSLDPVAAALRGASVRGLTGLARSIVEDVVEGFGTGELGADFGTALPRVTDELTQRSSEVGDRLTGAAGAYRRADWIAQVAAGGRR